LEEEEKAMLAFCFLLTMYFKITSHFVRKEPGRRSDKVVKKFKEIPRIQHNIV